MRFYLILSFSASFFIRIIFVVLTQFLELSGKFLLLSGEMINLINFDVKIILFQNKHF